MRIDIKKLYEKETPYYLYDLELLEETLKSIKEETKDHPEYHVHYAIKANANPLLLNVIREYGLGIDCVSGGEITASIQAGFPSESIVFAGVGKTDKEIDTALDSNIFSFNIESLEELDIVNERAKNKNKIAKVCLRINPDVDAHTHENITTGLAENKFGLPKDNVIKWISYANSLDNCKLIGLHFHIGSQLLDMAPYKMLCEEINILQSQLDSQGIHLRVINVGGGLGIDYEDPNKHPIPDFRSYFSIFTDNLELRKNQELHFELGRSVVGQCGTLITKALYVKQGIAKKHVIVDAGMTELIRPALYDAFHKVENISKTKNISLKDPIEEYRTKDVYDVVGPICESSDIFVKDYRMAESQRGDLIAIRSCGAYGETMSSTYNLRPLAKSYTIDDFL